MSKHPKTLDELLDEVSYEYLNSPDYQPSDFALRYMNFIKLIEADSRNLNKTPPMHLAMLDKIASPAKHIVNLCYRGSAKTTLMGQYMGFYLATFRTLPGVRGDIDGMLYVSDTMENGAKTYKESMQARYDTSAFLQDMFPKASFIEGQITLTNKDGKKFQIKMFGAATGIRGSQIFGNRPFIAVLDDLVSDKVANSATSMAAIKDTVYKGIEYALDPNNYKVIFNGTPFNKDDVIVSAVESGGWEVNVWPVCEKFPCEPEEFRGSWEDRFGYDAVNGKYLHAVGSKMPESFYQELMLRITNEEDRLVRESEINWYNSVLVLQYRNNFNFYITTDFATSEKQSADYSVISVWAHNAQGDWFWVDGYAERVTMDVNINRLFMYVQMYRPMSVGIETNGQQGGFISWINQEMFQKNIWFNLARSKGGSIGIRRASNKLVNFNYVVPLFKAGKMYFPDDKKDTEVMKVFREQVGLAMRTGFKGKDDFLDTISMLPFMEAIRPSPTMITTKNRDGIFESGEPELESYIDSYVV